MTPHSQTRGRIPRHLGPQAILSLRRSARGARHPRKSDHLRAFLARVSWPVLISEALLLTLAWSTLIGFLFSIGLGATTGGASRFALGDWITQAFFFTLGFPPESLVPPAIRPDKGLANVLAAGGALVIPALLTAAVVLKLFVAPDLFTFRSRVSLTQWSRAGSGAPSAPHLAIRCYSGTRFLLLNVRLSAILRVERVASDRSVVLSHYRVSVANPDFPIATRHFPFTLMLPLHAGDMTDDGTSIISLQSCPIGSRAVLIVIVTGVVPDLGTEFTEAHDYVLPDAFSSSQYAGLDFDAETRTWRGWDSFEE